MKRIKTFYPLLLAFLVSSCCNKKEEIINHETLHQTALLQSLMLGNFYGSASISEVLKQGDFGIGTFDSLDGEMVVLDGVCYKCLFDGSVQVMLGEEKTPFCQLSYFEEDYKTSISSLGSISQLTDKLNEIVLNKFHSLNYIYLVKISGKMKEVGVRSIKKQNPPYKTLEEVSKVDQYFYNYNDIEGTIIGVYCPIFMKNINANGWHFHYISSDHSKGGHLVSLKIDTDIIVKFDLTSNFSVQCPLNKEYQEMNFDIDLKEDIKKVEQPK